MILNRPVGGGGADVVVVPPGEEDKTRLERLTLYPILFLSFQVW